MGWEVGSFTAVILRVDAFGICSRRHAVLWCSSYLAFNQCIFSVHVVLLYSSMDTPTAWNKSSSVLSDIHMIDSQSIVFRAFTLSIFTSFSVDEMLLLRYVNLFTDFLEAYLLQWKWFFLV